MTIRAEQVNHPKHYNARPDGLECIDIIRHYTFDIGCAIKYLWRAGLKTEDGMTDREKEIEDLKKAIWYIEDQLGTSGIYLIAAMIRTNDIDERICRITGKKISEIVAPYPESVSDAITDLLCVGLIDNQFVYCDHSVMPSLRGAVDSIKYRIDELEAKLETIK